MSSSAALGSFFRKHFDYVSAVTRGDTAVTQEGIARWWVPAGRQYTNGRLVCAGYPELIRHYQEFPVKYAASEFQPVRWFRQQGQLAAVEFDLHLQLREPVDGVTGRTMTIMAAFVLEDGRIAEMRQVSA